MSRRSSTTEWLDNFQYKHNLLSYSYQQDSINNVDYIND